MDTRIVWCEGSKRIFHPSKSRAHRGYVYINRRRVYGLIELTGLGWIFKSHAAIEAARIERDQLQREYAHTYPI